MINPPLLEAYNACRKGFATRLGENGVNESLLFHGTPTDCLDKICANNFNRSFGKVEYYGHGVYWDFFFTLMTKVVK